MIRPEQIREILSIYRKHGWSLRRVLLSEALRAGLSDSLEELFGDTEIFDSDLDAVWFTRSSRPGHETWEIRRLSTSPYALCEVFNQEDEDDVREEVLSDLEERLRS